MFVFLNENFLKNLMRTTLLKNLLMISMLLCSCNYGMYQVMEIKSPSLKNEQNVLYFENNEIKVDYNFWAEEGKILYFITNKSDKPMYIDWFKCHLVYNGISYDYWSDAEEIKTFYSSSGSYSEYNSKSSVTNLNISSSTATSSSNTTIQKTGHGTATKLINTTRTKPIRIIQIPAKSAILVSKFNIASTPYYTCDYNLKVRRTNNPVSIYFGESDSPINFRNILTYSFDGAFKDELILDNKFYVGGIHIMDNYLFMGELKSEKRCNKLGVMIPTNYYEYPYYKASSFWVK